MDVSDAGLIVVSQLVFVLVIALALSAGMLYVRLFEAVAILNSQDLCFRVVEPPRTCYWWSYTVPDSWT